MMALTCESVGSTGDEPLEYASLESELQVRVVLNVISY